MVDRRPKPVVAIIFWGAIGLALVVVGIWCVFDGWFGNPGGPDPTFNKLMAIGCFVVLAWVISQGVKEYRKVKSLAEGQGAPAPTGQEPPSDSSPGSPGGTDTKT